MRSEGPTVALIVAAGRGERLGGTPKQYQPLGGRALLAHSVDACLAHPGIDAVQVVIGAGQDAAYRAAIGARALPAPVIGGATRRESVRAGLAAIAPGGRVLIHDAARPFLPAAVIDRLLAALETHDGAVPVLPVADSLAHGGKAPDSTLGEAVPRAGLVRVQTPQAFGTTAIVRAHALWPAEREATDDAQVARAAGLAVATVAGDPALDKITWGTDMVAAEARLATARTTRTALGFDVHTFTAGTGIRLGGVTIPHDRALAGHSDADVALHAITDALLGTIAAGDIGSHFPPSDPRWRGADSAIFLTHARDLVAAADGRIDHIDVTIICEAPKIGPHRATIRTRIATLLQVEEARISVKATTTERLGFTGRGEGIAAQAVASVRVPETNP
ncbi:MAG TPA: bifunctional 2-C-methyl-D-erythritol 4-phosphate cytidylyltransferase/2-C-methyl-D-erythritol 2,4-cyclodiphosphate synthase [Sphingomonadaceae bacterium]|nr:bifunctional 2-C-methyl-D-erythritol 4-phosphate cytidylyltransferase/2-C-methyl-D-erythritol 2,4-cyclodiphosphate synthase [Sphingomonadaceae bacterium]